MSKVAGGKSKKHGRNKAQCLSYKNSNKREKNKLKRLTERLAKHPNDKSAIAAVETCKRLIRGY